MLISDRRIRELCEVENPMIFPFCPELVRETEGQGRIISKGLSSFGYDVSLAEEFYLFTNIHSKTIDPKRPDPQNMAAMQVYTQGREKFAIMPPNSYVLCHTQEYFRIPRNMMVLCIGKSTYARSAIAVNITPIEAGFEGTVVIELSNLSNSPVKVYANEGIAQFMFFESEEDCETSYADRAGKYQGQTGITLSKV